MSFTISPYAFSQGFEITPIGTQESTSSGSSGSGSSLTNIFQGSSAFTSISVGSTTVTEVYVGSTKVWG